MSGGAVYDYPDPGGIRGSGVSGRGSMEPASFEAGLAASRGRGGGGGGTKNLINQVAAHGHQLDREMAGYVLEDTRLSTLQRKLAKETEPTVALAIAILINDCIIKAENATYIGRSADVLQAAVLEVMTSQEQQQAVKELCSIALGRIGALHPSFTTWGAAVWKLMEAAESDRLKALYIHAFVEAVNRGGGTGEGIDALLGLAKGKLEDTQSSVLVVALLALMNAVATVFPLTFRQLFTEVVDISVGWYMESASLPDVRRAIGNYIIAWAPFWKEEVEFGVDQVSFYVEDLLLEARTGGTEEDAEVLTDDDIELLGGFEYKWSSDDYEEAEKTRAQAQCLAFIQMIESVLTGLAEAVPLTLSKLGIWSHIVHSVTMHSLNWRWSEDMAIGGLKCMIAAYRCLLATRPGMPEAPEQQQLLVGLSRLLVERAARLSAGGQRVVMLCLRQLLPLLSAQALVELLPSLMGNDRGLLHLGCHSSHPEVQADCVELCHSLLLLKNVPLLQDVYRWLLQRYERAICLLAPELRPFTSSPNQAQPLGSKLVAKQHVMFILASISKIATSKGSVLSMWALEPSIFILLAHHSAITSNRLAADYPAIHHSILRLFLLHCSTHNYFISSSNLFNLSAVASSPTAGHFSSILQILTALLASASSAPSVKKMALECVATIFVSVKTTNRFLTTEAFRRLLDAGLAASFGNPSRLLRDGLRIIHAILDEYSVEDRTNNVPREIFQRMGRFLMQAARWAGDSATVHVGSVDIEPVRQQILRLLARLPAGAVLGACDDSCDSGAEKSFRTAASWETEELDILQRIVSKEFDIEGITSVEIRDFLAYIGQDGGGEDLIGIGSGEVEELEGNHAAVSAASLRSYWLSWTTSGYVVYNKLRSPVGKAQETLGAVDQACRRLAALSVNGGATAGAAVPLEQGRALVQFVAHLEKAMQNAWDGCATGCLAPAHKSASLFFYANKKTCQDWLERIRGNVMRVAYCVGSYGEVVRHGWCLLPVLAKKEELDSISNIYLVLITCLSLAMLGAPASLQGIYIWARDTARVRQRWIPGLVEMVKGHTEEGIKAIKTIIDTMENKKEQPETGPLLPLLGELVWSGHCSLAEQESYSQWVAAYQESSSPAAATPLQNVYLAALAKFDEGYLPNIVERLDGEAGPLTRFQSAVHQTLEKVHVSLMCAAHQIQRNYMKSNSNWNDNTLLTTALSQANADLVRLMGLSETTRGDKLKLLLLNSLWQELAAIKNRGASTIQLLPLLLVSQSLTPNQEPQPDGVLTDSTQLLLLVKKWTQFLARYKKASQQEPSIEETKAGLNLAVARTGRKEGNFALASRHLALSLQEDIDSTASTSLQDIIRNFDFFANPLSEHKAAVLRQAAKLLLLAGEENAEIAVSTVAGLALYVGQSQITMRYEASLPSLLRESSKALLHLTSAFQKDVSFLERVYPDAKSVHPDAATIMQVLQVESIIQPSRDTLQTPIPSSQAASEADMVIGRLLRLAVLQDANQAKAWNKLADWSYELGQKAVDTAAKANNKVDLTEDEKASLSALLPAISDGSRQKILNIISQIKLKDSHLAGYEYEKWDFMRRELLTVAALHSVPDQIFQQVTALWLRVFRRTYAYFDLAAEAYFKYLSLCGAQSAAGTISATLRLLHLTVNHTLELQDIFQVGLSTTPCEQWKAIIPQLFSRLNHPVPIVRQRISDLLCRISERYPHLIIFPAVVGSLTTGSQTTQTLTNIFTGSLLRKEASPDMEAAEAGGTTYEMISAHAKIVEALKKRSPTAIEQVSILISELRRITLLWEELWLGTLAQYSGEVQRRVNRFQQEADRLSLNTNLTAEEKLKLLKDKYSIVFSPVLYVLDQVMNITKVRPETPHEEAFQRKYERPLGELLDELRNPADWIKPTQAWSNLATIQQQLNARVNKKNSTLKLSEISPALQALRNTDIMMPGEMGESDQIVQISRFEGTMVVLPTKTKPKKFSLVGDNGKRFTFLFKGLEDLHLDERIMQFLGISNEMMRRHKKDEGSGRYFARNYSVIPLGPRSGLIQWVEGAVPLFSIYKKWQLRQQGHLEAAKKPEAAAKVISKPSDAFYWKVVPLLRKHGVLKLEERKAWPISLLKQVLQELLQETPNDLLTSELWLKSVTSEQWWTRIQNIGRSFAVMSVIGYIIGLGDRHLDNILVNLDQGHIVHIDYNISFEKGRNLHIPERVPCRLTQNIIAAFGVSGVEGLFRTGCEHTLGAMRQERETLLTLLEAFVYDPLVDWTPGLAGGLAGAMYGGQGGQQEEAAEEKRDLEHSLTFSMLGVRMAEMRATWTHNQHDLMAALIQVEEGLSAWLELEAGASRRSERLAALHRSMSMLKEAEVNPNHRLHSCLDAYRRTKAVAAQAEAARQRLEAFIAECDRMGTLQARAVAAISGHQLAKWEQETAALLEQSLVLSSKRVKVFLENAGQRDLLTQFQAIEAEMAARTKKLCESVKGLLEGLNVYQALTSLYPSLAKSQHRISMYSQWGNWLVESFTVENCDAIAVEFGRMFAPQPPLSGVHPDRKVLLVRSVNDQLEQWHTEILVTTQRTYQRMMSESVMKPGKSGVLEEMGRTRDTIFNQLNHPDSGVRPDNLLVFFLNQLAAINTKWLELDKGLAEENLINYNNPARVDSLLEQMFIQAGTASTILNTMDMLNLAKKSSHVQALDSLCSLLRCLRELERNYSTIIMPEGVKKFLQGEQTVVDTARQLVELVSSIGIPLDEIKHELRLHTRCVMLGMESQYKAMVEMLQSLRTRYAHMVRAAATADSMTTGQMLLCAVNSLFENIDTEMERLRERVANAPTPTECVKFTTVAQALDISTAAFSPTPGVWDSLQNVVFVSKLEVLSDFFGACEASARAFSCEHTGTVLPTGYLLLRPVKKLVGEYVQSLLVGTGVRHLSCAIVELARDCSDAATTRFFETNSTRSKVEVGDLCQSVYDDKMATGALNQARIAKCTMLTKNLWTVIHKWEMVQHLDMTVGVLEAAQQVNALQHAALQWFYADLLPHDVKPAEPDRIRFLADIRARGTQVMALCAELQDLANSFTEIKAAVDQRLRWAVGANPQLQDVVDQFSSEHGGQMENVRQAGLLVKSLAGVLQSTVHYELLRTRTQESQASDHQFLALIAMARESASLAQLQQPTGVGEAEVSLLDMNPPKERIDLFWIRQTEEIIATSVRKIQDQVQAERKQCMTASKRVVDTATCMRDLMATHHKLMADVAVLLRTISKIENLDFPGVSTYLLRYKEFSDLVSSLVRLLSMEELTVDRTSSASAILDRLRVETSYIYEELMKIAAVARDENLVQEMFKSRRMKEEEPRKDEPEMEERSAAKKVEEKNRFALSVLKRVRVKLEGREPDSLRKSSVGEQVDFMIREATNMENLALMYEGWTAWI